MLYSGKRARRVDFSEVRQRLNQVREKADMNQTAFATLLGQQPSTISEILSGKRGISVPVLVALVQHGVSLDWLLAGEGRMMLPDAARVHQQVAEQSERYVAEQRQAIVERLKAVIAEFQAGHVEGKKDGRQRRDVRELRGDHSAP